MMYKIVAPFVLALASLSALPANAQSTAPDAAAQASGLQKIDVKTGEGRELQPGQTAVVHYSGWLYDSFAPRERGQLFDSSSGRTPLTFRVGAGQVIKGWDLGVAGMKIGGKRTLVIPSELGYGARGAGNMIPPHSTLIFDVELIDIR